MASELLPCPFCGGTDVNLHHSAKAFMSWISCKSCGLDAPSETGVTDEEAITYWNTRPAPAATDTGLETFSVEMLRDYAFMKADPEGDYVTRSQAEELLADAQTKSNYWAGQCGELYSKVETLKADNAALTARVKELDRCHEGTIDLCNKKTAQIEALEAQLAAAEKALTEIASLTQTTDLLWWQERARAALGGTHT